MAATVPSQAEQSDLQALVLPLWRHRWLLVVIVVISTVGTYVMSRQQSPRFRSSTEIFVANSQIESIVGGAPADGTDRSTLDQAKLMLSEPVLMRVIGRLHLRESPSSLMSTVTATPSAGSNFVSVTAEGSSGPDAAAVANSIATEYIAYRNEQLNQDAGAALRRLRGQLAGLPGRGSNVKQRSDLQDTIRQLEAATATTPSQVRQTDRATPASVPFTPRPKRNAAFALAISLALSIALAFALERFDRRIRTVDEVSDAYGLPLLASIPHTPAPIEFVENRAVVPDVLREPFRSLRTNVQLASVDQPAICLAVISANSGEGKSTVIRNLALTYREWGLSVAVVEADLRRPTLSSAFGVSSDAGGLTAVLTGDCALEAALIDIEFDVTRLEYLDRIREAAPAGVRGGETSTQSGRLVLLPSGAMPPNPQAVLAADRTRQILGWFTDRFDVVLIDTPPLLAVSDAVPLLALADGVILISRLGATDRTSARRVTAAAQLDPDVSILGVVANDITFQPGTGYGYGYGYY